MTDAARPLHPERLLAEMDWARRLARALAGELAADDVAQEAMRIALEKPPELAPGTSLRAWLRGVIQNLARSQRERTARRAYHEHRAARPESVEHESGGHERVLEQRRLADAVLALDEPYRSAIVLRYFDDLSPREVAARQRVSYDAARQRISRGLSMLRARLDERGGSARSSWMVLAAPAPARWLGWSLGGAFMSGKLALAGAAVLVLLGGWWWRAHAGREVSPELSTPAAALPSSGSTAALSDAAPAPETPARAAAVPAPAPATAGRGRAVDRERELSGVVVDPSGAPVADAEVHVRRNPLDEVGTLDLVNARESFEVARARTSAAGEFAFEVPEARALGLSVEAAGFAGFFRAHCHAGEFVRVQLEPASVVHGRVTRLGDGSPVADARVDLALRERAELPHAGATRTATTDGRGHYRFDGLPAGSYSLKVMPRADSTPPRAQLELAGGQVLQQDFAVDRGHTLRGRVTEAGTGIPIAGAVVGEGWTAARNVTTDADGEYVFEGFSSQGYYDIDVCAKGYGRRSVLVRQPDAPFPERVDVELSRARALAGRVLDAQGAAIERAYVAAVAYEIESEAHDLDWESVYTGPDGRFEITSLAPELHHTLWIRREGYASFARQLPARELDTPRLDVGDVVLLRGGSVFGAVVDEQSEPIAGMAVELSGMGSEFNAWESRTFGRAALFYLAGRSTRCDDLGRFSFADLPPGDYQVTALRTDSHDRPTKVAVQVGAEQTVRGVELVVRRGLSISGRVHGPDGEAVKGYVSVDPELPGVATSGDVEVEPDGTFLVTGLEPGAYRLTVYPMSLWWKTQPGKRYARTEKSEVAAGSTGVDVAVPRAAAIRGRAVDAAGLPLAGAIVSATPSQGDSASAGCDEAGEFALWVPEGALCDLYLDPKPREEAPDNGVVLEHPRTPSDVPVLRGVLGGGDPIVLRQP